MASRGILLALVALVACASCDPVFLVPPRLRAGEQAIIVLDPSAQNVKGTLISMELGVVGAEQSLDGGLLSVGDLAPGKYTLSISYTFDGVSGTQSSEVAVIADPVFLLLDLDKPKYKPSETVQVRILALKADFSPMSGGEVEVTIINAAPAKFKIFRETLAVTELGDANVTLPLPDEPVLGQYTLIANYNGDVATATATFDVDEFVLPKFEVKVEVDQVTVPASGGRLTGKVSAVYTYGEAVNGRLKLTIYQNSASWNPWVGRGGGIAGIGIAGGMADMGVAPSPSSSYNTITEIEVDLGDGLYQFSAPSTGSMELSPYSGDVLVEASVFDAATGTTEKGDASVAVAREGDNVRLELPSDFFRPGLPVTVTLAAVDGMGQPLEKAFSVRVTAFKQYSYMSPADKQLALADPKTSPLMITTTGGSGSAEVMIPRDDPACCDPTQYLEVSQESCCTVSVQVSVVGDNGYDVESKCLRRAQSASLSYLSLSGPSEPVAPGGVASFKLAATAEWGASLRYSVASRGAIVAGGPAGPLLTAPPDDEGGVVTATLEIPVTSAMGPAAKVVVLFTGPAGEVVADTATLDVATDLATAVSAGFVGEDGEKPANAAPGDQVKLSLAAPAGSRVFYTALDRAVTLLGPRAEVSAAGALAALAGLEVEVQAKLPQAPADAEKEDAERFQEHLFTCCRLAGQTLAEAGVIASTSGDDRNELYTPCLPIYGGCGGCYSDDVDVMFDDMAEMAAAGAGGGGIVPANGARTDKAGEAGATVTRARTYFPETWLWSWVDMDRPNIEIPVETPDTITTWELAAFASHADSGLGVSAPSAGLRVFQPFFLSVKLPFHATRGEALEVLVTIFNYDEGGREVTSSLALEPKGEGAAAALGITSEEEGDVTVPAGGFATRTFTVRASGLGRHTLRASASASGPAAVVGEPLFRDVVERPLLVKPEGVPEEMTTSQVIELAAGDSPASYTLPLAVPEGAVEGSVSAALAVVGDVMGPTLDGLERLLSVPTGCGEQNMITLAPNVYVARYLRDVNSLTESIRKRVLSNMIRGYQRELTYRHSDGSYSAFGESDGDGSMWLTAFVLKVFGQASEFITVDDDVLSSAGAWVASKQGRDGSFPLVGQVIHTEMVGGVSGPATMTAYVLGALADAPKALASSEGVVGKAVGYLASELRLLEGAAAAAASPSAQEVYALTLAGYALARCDANAAALSLSDADKGAVATALGGARERLDKFAQTGEGNVKWWGGEAGGVSTGVAEDAPVAGERMIVPYPGHATTTDIESTAYGLLTYLGTGSTGDAYPVARWLLERRSASGGFVSTQDTVVGLQALAAYTAATYSRAGSVAVDFDDGAGTSGQVTVEAANFDIVQLRPLVPGGAVSVDASSPGGGGGTALVSATVRYNRLAPAAQDQYSLEVTWTAVANQPRRKAVRACLSQGAAEVEDADKSMAIAQLVMFSGYSPDVATLEELKKKNEIVQRWDYDGESVSLYLTGVPASETCLEFVAAQEHVVSDLQDITSKLFDYYSPAVGALAPSSARTEAFAAGGGDDAGGRITAAPTPAKDDGGPKDDGGSAATPAPTAGGGTSEAAQVLASAAGALALAAAGLLL